MDDRDAYRPSLRCDRLLLYRPSQTQIKSEDLGHQKIGHRIELIEEAQFY
jgi:hypothetical protein